MTRPWHRLIAHIRAALSVDPDLCPPPHTSAPDLSQFVRLSVTYDIKTDNPDAFCHIRTTSVLVDRWTPADQLPAAAEMALDLQGGLPGAIVRWVGIKNTPARFEGSPRGDALTPADRARIDFGLDT